MLRRLLNFFLNIDETEDGGPRTTTFLRRSGLVTATLVVLLVAGLTFAAHERGKGDLSRLQRRIDPDLNTPAPPTPMPGGMAPIVLTRSQLVGEAAPQFLSATLLPGRGMNVLQITAYVPGKGEVELLASPTLEKATEVLTGTGTDSLGAESLKMGAAPMIPWAGSMGGTVSSAGSAASSAGEITTVWQGQRIQLPAEIAANSGRGSEATARGGLMLERRGEAINSGAMPDGSATTVSYHAGDFNHHWPSSTDVSLSVLMSGKSVEVTMAVKNVGNASVPIGIGWNARFLVPPEARGTTLLHLPATERVEIQARGGTSLPTGRLLPVAGTPFDFRAREGRAVGNADLDTTFTDLQTGFLDSGPVVELCDRVRGYGLRIKLLSSKILAVHVAAPAGADYIAISPQFNLEDPFGREWPKSVDTGMHVLEPGQSVEWKLRIELFDPAAQAKATQLTNAVSGLPAEGGATPP